jgi:hypothetical protein
LSKVLKDRYPGAKGVRFKNGEEVKYKWEWVIAIDY